MNPLRRLLGYLFSGVFFVVLLSTITGCKRQEKSIAQQERVVLNVREQLGVQAQIELRKAIEYHGRYYCVFEHDGLFPMNNRGHMLFSIEKTSRKVMQLPWPNEANSFYDELFVRHDTLFLDLYGSWHEHNFFYDTLTSQWIKCSELDKLVYEDADYRVYAMDNGEFGQAMWFENLNSRNEYVLEGLGDVHRLGDTFYVVGRNLVRTLTINQLSEATPSSKTHHHAADDYSVFWYDTVPPLGGDTVYSDPRYNLWEDFYHHYHDTVIVGSFVSDDKLQLVVNRPDSTALMCIAGTHELQTTRLLGEHYNFTRRGRIGRVLTQTDEVLLPFQRDYFSMGLLDIKGNKIEVLEIGHDIDTLVAQPTDGLKPLLVYLRDHWHHITDSAIHHFERSNGGTFLTTESTERSGYFRDLGFREGFHIDYFYKLVDTLYIVCTEYCVRENDGAVVAVFMEMMSPKYDFYTRAQQIRSLITARLDDICGPYRRCKGDRLWHFDPLRIILFDELGRLLIY